jgi:excisionase family DNA binding protein
MHAQYQTTAPLPGRILMSRALRPPARGLEPLLTIRQAADLMQLSDKTVRRRITDGSLIALRIGSQWRIQRCDLQAFLRESTVQ